MISGDVTLADSRQATTTFVMPATAVEVKANFEANTYTITASSKDGGAISTAGEITVTHGKDQAFLLLRK